LDKEFAEITPDWFAKTKIPNKDELCVLLAECLTEEECDRVTGDVFSALLTKIKYIANAGDKRAYVRTVFWEKKRRKKDGRMGRNRNAGIARKDRELGI
jgi:hypothetical protein